MILRSALVSRKGLFCFYAWYRWESVEYIYRLTEISNVQEGIEKRD